MNFSSVVAQDNIKELLRLQLVSHRIPHAQLFCGPKGCGKLPMALAFARALLCQSPSGDGEACGMCRACKMLNNLEHPDLHFIYPIKKVKNETRCATYIKEWREELLASPYLDTERWYAAIEVENQQPIITTADADEIGEKLALTAQQGGYRVVIVWHPECLNEQAANKMLKILEEPPAQTVFLLVSDTPERLLPTILSRLQRVEFPALTQHDLEAVLKEQHGLGDEDAKCVAHVAAGSYTAAVNQLQVNAEQEVFFDMFVLLMRKCYMRDIMEMYRWSDIVAGWGREKQKAFLQYSQRLIRENFILNFHEKPLNYMGRKEMDFSVRFSPFVNERNVIGIMRELEQAENDVVHNVSPKIVFFDFALKMIVLLIQ